MEGYIATFVISLLVAFAELLNIYKDDMIDILKISPSYLYCFLNAFSSIIAYWFIQERFVLTELSQSATITKVLAAATSSVLLMRSSFFNYKIGNRNIDIGLAAITKVFLSRAERKLDQMLSEKKLKEIRKIMAKIDFQKAQVNLPSISLSLMQNLSRTEQRYLGKEINTLNNELRIDSRVKSLQLGILLSKLTGYKLLNTLVDELNETLAQVDHDQESQKLSEQMMQLKEKFINVDDKMYE